ncbi:DUF2115 domain-containing protein [Methanospirillum stamsii]|uniref:UPF0305 protein DLD82_00355 n=1 Tax=Methanospirillum stamsii TaxID=1277351 RepID=A0A2V2NFG0_9EURY|nr:DUF2115 domain-containing protein [Methanospirillum stamsii]PWR76296.1 hypothetical protein DLD82_00355 [Methanospirillum stamsii]
MTCDMLSGLESRRDLGEAIADLVLDYSPRYLTKMKVNFSDKIDSFPDDYKRELEETIASFLDGTYQKIRLMKQQGSFSTLDTAVSEHAKKYWGMVAIKCPGDDIGSRIRFLKYLLSGFCMFVQEIPGHPVGMPFPGGDKVNYIDGVYYCPVRTKAHDVDAALCPFCPAKQTPEVGYLKPPVKGSKHRKQEYIKDMYDYHHFNG